MPSNVARSKSNSANPNSAKSNSAKSNAGQSKSSRANNAKPRNQTKRQTDKKLRRSSAKESAANATALRLWIGLAIFCGLGLIAFVLLLRLLLPMLLLLGLIALGYWTWRSVHRYHQRRRRRQARLNTQFYQLLKRQQGRISALDFAMFTQTDGLAAQDYLNEQAQAFSAYCETTIQGDIVYVFNLAAINQLTQNESAQIAWEEQARAQRAYRERKKAAWISAKQMQALRERSPKETNHQPVIPLPAPPDEYRDLSQDQPKPTQFKHLQKPKQSHKSPSTSNGQPVQDDKTSVTIDVKAVRS